MTDSVKPESRSAICAMVDPLQNPKFSVHVSGVGGYIAVSDDTAQG
jgi:hypothetical protein